MIIVVAIFLSTLVYGTDALMASQQGKKVRFLFANQLGIGWKNVYKLYNFLSLLLIKQL
jgi:hypothetical protein